MMNNKKLLIINFFTFIAFVIVLAVGMTYSAPDYNSDEYKEQLVNKGLKVNSKRNNIIYKEDDHTLFKKKEKV